MLFDKEKMVHLISNLYILTGIRANLLDAGGRDLRISAEGTDFCKMIQSTPGGLARCQSCDRNAMQHCRERDEVIFYRCHAGLCEAIQPIRTEGRTVAYLMFGEYLDHTPRQQQWEDTLRRVSWYSGSREALREAFDRLDQYTPQKIEAYQEIIGSLESYIYMSGMIFPYQYTDQQRLEQYLDQHYKEKLSLSSISRDLNMGRTKLCTLAREMPGGYTICQLITQRRIREACTLLLRTDLPISEVSEAVGISDYNYFSKVFRLTTGMTPSAYRRTRAAGDENIVK